MKTKSKQVSNPTESELSSEAGEGAQQLPKELNDAELEQAAGGHSTREIVQDVVAY